VVTRLRLEYACFYGKGYAMDAFTLYLLTRCSAMNDACVLCGMLEGIATVAIAPLALMASSVGKDEHIYALTGKLLRWLVPIGLAAALGTVVIPTTQEMALIYVLPKLANNPSVKKDCGDIYDLAVAQLKKEIGPAAGTEQPE
jgi:hypothetical protein